LRLKECDVTQRPLYGVLVVGELPHEADPRTFVERRPQRPPAESFLKKILFRWLRKSHATAERSS
jgi:hypothetical protein